MRVILTVTEGPHTGKTYCFSGHETFLVGRSKRAHFRLPAKDRFFSRIHFLVEVNPPHCQLLDMGSLNGTHVNGERVEKVSLQDGDHIRAGKTVLRVEVRATEAKGDSQPPIVPVVREAVSEKMPAPMAVPVVVASSPMPVAAVAPTQEKIPAIAVAPPPIERPKGLAQTIEPRNHSVAALKPTPSQPVSQPTLPAPPVHPPVRPPPVPPSSVPAEEVRKCGGCGQPTSSANSPWLCLPCAERVQRQPQPLPGYCLLRELGQGSMGLVYLAVNRVDGQPVAVKTVTPSIAGSPPQVQRFLREAQILRQLKHPHIVGFRDLGETQGLFYFAMDYVKGQDAGKLLKRAGQLPLRRAVTLACQLLDALAFAHARGYIHRDIKPSNLLVTVEAGQEMIKVVDFGLARVYQASQFSGLTLTGDIGGTMAFIPPEQITEYREARPPADQYAAAATLYNLLTNAFIYDLPTEFHKQILTILQEDPVPIQKRRRDLPGPLCMVIHKALAREPIDRFDDVSAFRQALLPFRE